MTLKIEKFSGSAGPDFQTWWYLYEYLLAEQDVEEENQKVNAIILHLAGPALAWFVGLKRDGRLPRTLAELKRAMSRRFDSSAALKMRESDLDGYIQGVDRIVEVAAGISEEDKKAIFIEGLSDFLFPHLVGFAGNYSEAKEFASKLMSRHQNSQQTVEVFRADTKFRSSVAKKAVPEVRKFICYLCKKEGHKKYDCPKLKEFIEKSALDLKSND